MPTYTYHKPEITNERYFDIHSVCLCLRRQYGAGRDLCMDFELPLLASTIRRGPRSLLNKKGARVSAVRIKRVSAVRMKRVSAVRMKRVSAVRMKRVSAVRMIPKRFAIECNDLSTIS
jgi:hypothetical protein